MPLSTLPPLNGSSFSILYHPGNHSSSRRILAGGRWVAPSHGWARTRGRPVATGITVVTDRTSGIVRSNTFYERSDEKNDRPEEVVATIQQILIERLNLEGSILTNCPRTVSFSGLD